MIRISPTGNSGRASARGFTLIELLVVLTIMAVLVSSITFVLLNRRDTLNKIGGDIVHNLQLVRQRAIRDDRPLQVEVDLGRNSLRFVDESIVLADDISITVRTAQNQVVASDIAGLTFYPDASSSGGVITLETDDEVFEITIVWISSKIQTRHQSISG